MRRSTTFPSGRCCWSPTNFSMRCRSASIVGGDGTAGHDRRRRAGIRSRWRDRRDIACARRSRRGDRDASRRARRRGALRRLRPCQARPGDTLQAVRRHGFAPVLANPGEQDLTAHVDFEAVGAVGARGRRVGDAAGLPGRMAEARSASGRAPPRLATANPERAEELAAARPPAYRRRSDGRAVQGDRDPCAGLAGAGGVRMTALTRDATAEDLPTIDRLFRASFADTFAHLYAAKTSRAFLAQIHARRLGARVRRSALRLPHRGG